MLVSSSSGMRPLVIKAESADVIMGQNTEMTC